MSNNDLEEPKPVDGMMRIQYYLDGEWHTINPGMLPSDETKKATKFFWTNDYMPVSDGK